MPFNHDPADLQSKSNQSIGDLTISAQKNIFSPLLLIALYVAYMLTTESSWVLSGEMYAEMATNYFVNANSSSYLDRLFATDAGYIPFPQRLIALMGVLLHLPARVIPFFYTWTAIISSGALVGSFCSTRFRAIVASDSLRFLVAITILMIADFESRTFINFTYFSCFFIAALTALAWSQDLEELPWWAWFIPIFLFSKPAVLAIYPAMVLVACIRPSRFRRIVIVSTLFCMAQILQMAISAHSSPAQIKTGGSDLFLKLEYSAAYFFGFIGKYFIGETFHFNKYFLMLTGLLIFIGCTAIIYRYKSKSLALIIIGFSICFFNILLNVFALGGRWNAAGMDMLSGIQIHRHVIIIFIGCSLVISGLMSLLEKLLNPYFSGYKRAYIGSFLFIAWLLLSGWLVRAVELSKAPLPPTINSSQWQKMATAIEGEITPLCVPVNPWGEGINWIYPRSCGLLNQRPFVTNKFILVNNVVAIDPTFFGSLGDKALLGAALFVKMPSSQKEPIEILLNIKLKNGLLKQYSGFRNIDNFGGLLMLTGDAIAVNSIASITLLVSNPVQIAIPPLSEGQTPGVAWLGY